MLGHYFKASHRLVLVTQYLSLAVPWLCGLFLICNYKGKGVVRINTRNRMYLAQSQKKIDMKCGSCRAKGQKSKLSHRHAESGAVKVKKKKKKNQECSGLLIVLSIFFVLTKGKEKNLIFLFFLFTTVMTVILTTTVINIPFARVKVLAVY